MVKKGFIFVYQSATRSRTASVLRLHLSNYIQLLT